MTLCAPWLEANDVTLCDETDPMLPRALMVASELLFLATAQRFTGKCTDNVRPCNRTGAVQWLDYNTGGSRPINVMAGCGCDGGDGELACGCMLHSKVKLPGTPVSEIVEVKVDGVALTAGVDYRIVSDQWLVRTGGKSWPCCQRLDLLDTEPGTWSVRYTYGLLPPESGKLAAERLACELVAGWCQGPGCPDCLLPKRLTQLTYEGATMATLDPFSFLDDGRFGIAEVDYFISQFNPNHLQRNAVARTARDFLREPHRVR